MGGRKERGSTEVNEELCLLCLTCSSQEVDHYIKFLMEGKTNSSHFCLKIEKNADKFCGIIFLYICQLVRIRNFFNNDVVSHVGVPVPLCHCVPVVLPLPMPP